MPTVDATEDHRALFGDILRACAESPIPTNEVVGLLVLIIAQIESYRCPGLAPDEIADKVRGLVGRCLQKRVH